MFVAAHHLQTFDRLSSQLEVLVGANILGEFVLGFLGDDGGLLRFLLGLLFGLEASFELTGKKEVFSCRLSRRGRTFSKAARNSLR